MSSDRLRGLWNGYLTPITVLLTAAWLLSWGCDIQHPPQDHRCVTSNSNTLDSGKKTSWEKCNKNLCRFIYQTCYICLQCSTLLFPTKNIPILTISFSHFVAGIYSNKKIFNKSINNKSLCPHTWKFDLHNNHWRLLYILNKNHSWNFDWLFYLS